MAVKVAKFGGTSMSTAQSILNVANIIKSDEERRYVVVSAPGKRNDGDRKVTDLLYACVLDVEMNGECTQTFGKIRERFVEIVRELNLQLDITAILDAVEKNIVLHRNGDYAASRGEYLGAVVMAGVLGYEFIDAEDLIMFNEKGEFLPDITNDNVAMKLAGVQRAVIPGFYGKDNKGNIRTFSRGGSDVTGAIIARAAKASVYENWTDVNGFMTTDPRIVNNPIPINELTYRELRELSYMGANVLHPESIFPVRFGNIPINIRNTFEPNNPGTMIVGKSEVTDERVITGIAGKKGYSFVFIEKSMMNSEIGFARRVLSVFEYYGVTFEHMPSGIDTLSVVVADSEIAGKDEVILDRIKKTVNPDHIEIMSGYSIIATVGHGMRNRPGTAARIFDALARGNINIRMIDQGSSELNIIVAVATKDYEAAVRAIYSEFC